MTAPRPFTVDTLVAIRRLGSFDISPDGRFAVAVVEDLSADGKTYDANLLRIPLDLPGEPVALTQDTRRKAQPRFAPDGTLFYLAQPDSGARKADALRESEKDEKKPAAKDDDSPLQVHRLRVDGGAPQQVTNLPCGVDAFEIAPDGARLVMLASSHPSAGSVEENRALEKEWKERKTSGRVIDTYPVRFWDHYHGPRFPHLVVAAIDGSMARDLTPGFGSPGDGPAFHESSISIAPDGKTACVDIKRINDARRFENHLFLVDLASGERRQITQGSADHWAPRFSPSGRQVAALTSQTKMRITGKRDIEIIDVATGEARLVTGSFDAWAERPWWVDEDTLAFSHDEAGHHVVRVLDLKSGASRRLSERGHASELRLTPDRTRAVYALDALDFPADLHVVALSGGEARTLTHLNAALLEGMALPQGTSSTFTGSESKPVQAWEVRPPDFDEKKKYPLLLWIHGGPIHAYLDQFHFRWNAQIYAAAGYVVIMVNPRGSTGFGQEFIEDNNGDWGNRCYRDLMLAVDEWSARPYIDEARIAACGASFGGYMVNWIAGHETRFRCLVSHAGLFHLPGFHGTTDAGPEWELEFGGVPWESIELYDKWSPHRFVGAFQTPTLVIHGELDYRVPIGEGLQMFQALQQRKVPSRFLYFPDENHWILKPANMRLWNETVLAWLKQWMG